MNNRMVDRLLEHLEIRGLSVSGPKEGDPDDRLYLHGPQEERTPEIMDGLKKFRGKLVEVFGRRRPEESTGGER
jgi:hypothetical protein